MLFGIWAYLGDKLSNASKTILDFGKSTKSKIQGQINSLLDREDGAQKAKE